MKKYAVLLAVISLFVSASFVQVFAAGSASGGSTQPVVEETKTEAPIVEATKVTETTATVTNTVTEDPVLEEVKVDTTVTETAVSEAEAVRTTAESGSETEAAGFCFELEDRKARIECRLGKTAAEVKTELAENFMPEECGAMNDDHKKELCTERYKSVQPCWAKAHGAKRIACVKKALEIDRIAAIDDYCKGGEKACAKNYRWKVYNLITFRFYDAEERAEIWHREGHLSLDETVEFVDLIVDSKIKFYNGETMAEKTVAIEGVQKAWDELVEKVKASKSK